MPKISPVDLARRHFLTVAAGGAAATLAIPATAQADATELPPSDGFERVLDHHGRVWFKADGILDPAFALIDAKRAADVAHGKAIDAQDEAEREDGIDPDAAESSTRQIGGSPRRHPRHLPASPRCSGSPMKSRTAAWSGPPPTRLVRRACISGFSQPRHCGDEVWRMLVTGGPPNFGGGGFGLLVLRPATERQGELDPARRSRRLSAPLTR
jgi:hypothetical protein